MMDGITIEKHIISEINIAEIIADGIIIEDAEDGKDIMGNLYFQGYDRIVIHQRNITPHFFDLKNGIAGEILQKFSNYRMRLAIVGDFNQLASKSINDFIYESNMFGRVNFVNSVSEALSKLANTNG